MTKFPTEWTVIKLMFQTTNQSTIENQQRYQSVIPNAPKFQAPSSQSQRRRSKHIKKQTASDPSARSVQDVLAHLLSLLLARRSVRIVGDKLEVQLGISYPQ